MRKPFLSLWDLQFALAIILCCFGIGCFILTGPIYVHILYLAPDEALNIPLLQRSIFLGVAGVISLCFGIYLSARVRMLTETFVTGEKPNYSHLNRVLLFLILITALGVILVALANYQIWTIIRQYIHTFH
ncbi:MAG: hypothetical protein ACFE89_01185 [Candidatus Hodarchaeota archaeon]